MVPWSTNCWKPYKNAGPEAMVTNGGLITQKKMTENFHGFHLEVISRYLYGIVTPFRTGDGAHRVTYILWFCTYFHR